MHILVFLSPQLKRFLASKAKLLIKIIKSAPRRKEIFSTIKQGVAKMQVSTK